MTVAENLEDDEEDNKSKKEDNKKVLSYVSDRSSNGTYILKNNFGLMLLGKHDIEMLGDVAFELQENPEQFEKLARPVIQELESMGYSSNVANLVVRRIEFSRDITSNRLDRLKLRKK